MCFCSLENDTMSNAFFPILHFIIIFFLLFTKRKVWFNLNMRATLMWKKKLVRDKKLKTASDHSNIQFLLTLRKQKYQYSWCKCSSQRVESTPKMGTQSQWAVVEPKMMFLHHTIIVLWPKTASERAHGWAHTTHSRSQLHTPGKLWNSLPVPWTLSIIIINN